MKAWTLCPGHSRAGCSSQHPVPQEGAFADPSGIKTGAQGERKGRFPFIWKTSRWILGQLLKEAGCKIHRVRLELTSAWLFSSAETSQLGRQGGTSPGAPAGHGQSPRRGRWPRAPGEAPLLCPRCCVPAAVSLLRPLGATAGAASQRKSLRHGTGKVHVGMRVGKR